MRVAIAVILAMTACTDPDLGASDQPLTGSLHFGSALSAMRNGWSVEWDGLHGRIRIEDTSKRPEVFIFKPEGYGTAWTLWDPSQDDIAARTWAISPLNP